METILSISGKPGLYKLLSQSKKSFIVEVLDDTHHRMPVFATDRITSLSDVAMYTDSDDVPLWQVLKSMGAKENNSACPLNYKKCSANELHDYFKEVLPKYDRDRVHDSDIRKLIQWYNILINAGINDFEKTFKAAGKNDTDTAE